MNDEKFLKTIELLIEKNDEIPVIVEGKRDLISLRKVGLKGQIIIFNNGKKIIEFTEEIIENYREIIILFDRDRKGKLLTETISRILSSRGIHVILEFREMIFNYSEAKSIEEIYTYYENSLERKINGKRWKNDSFGYRRNSPYSRNRNNGR
ncbi:MAG: toprim domain-containing protein [Thermoplasmata archaeon]